MANERMSETAISNLESWAAKYQDLVSQNAEAWRIKESFHFAVKDLEAACREIRRSWAAEEQHLSNAEALVVTNKRLVEENATLRERVEELKNNRDIDKTLAHVLDRIHGIIHHYVETGEVEE